MARALAGIPALALLAVLAGCAGGGPARSPVPATPAAPPAPTAPTPAAPTAGAPTDPQPATETGPAGPCTGATLDISATPARTDGDAQTQELIFRNTGAAACVLSGYPGVMFVAGNAGTRVGAMAGIDGPRNTVRLAPGAAATAPLRVTDAGSYPETDCAAEEVRGIRVAPPGGSGGLFVPRPGRACSGEPDEPQALVGSVTGR